MPEAELIPRPVTPGLATPSRRRWLAALPGLAAWAGAVGAAQAAVDPASVPEPERTRAALYLEVRDMPAFIESRGGLSKDSRRSVNGWQNAGLPWSCRLDKVRIGFPR